MKLLISGSRGFIGSALCCHMRQQGHDVFSLVRSSQDRQCGDIFWDPDKGKMDAKKLEGLHGIVHLAGENIATGRWTKAKKERIRTSRVRGTALLSETVAKLKKKPAVFICASAVGFYGDRGGEVLHEESGPGKGFLADVCASWELATNTARKAGVRTVNLRIGVVLAKKGGALTKMLLPFRCGLGGRFGSGNQFVSWVSLQDLVRIMDFILQSPGLQGPVNAVSPNPTTNAEFTKALGQVLKRPARVFVPAFLLKAFLGEMADGLFLSSIRVKPKALLDHGFEFSNAHIVPTLAELLQHSCN